MESVYVNCVSEAVPGFPISPWFLLDSFCSARFCEYIGLHISEPSSYDERTRAGRKILTRWSMRTVGRFRVLVSSWYVVYNLVDACVFRFLCMNSTLYVHVWYVVSVFWRVTSNKVPILIVAGLAHRGGKTACNLQPPFAGVWGMATVAVEP